MLWIIPPGFILDIGIILFAVPGLEFAYSQAPASMRTVIMAGWLLTTAIGNLIIVIIQTIDPFEKSVGKRIKPCSLLLIFRISVLQLFVVFSSDVAGCSDFWCNVHQIQIR